MKKMSMFHATHRKHGIAAGVLAIVFAVAAVIAAAPDFCCEKSHHGAVMGCQPSDCAFCSATPALAVPDTCPENVLAFDAHFISHESWSSLDPEIPYPPPKS